ncbi:DUF3619 family protein [Leeia sp. TBRC 13508]|uniref:DUF3619 family protein n=1 Tax=Leeia speluncae TaxID=2884804 RepID=A0ABS8D2P7_9NEIS|nr:DUF3619 family protein [Leeia speluncae]MCB6182476.1 DUF3619 family protein [Leeia speluncae]
MQNQEEKTIRLVKEALDKQPSSLSDAAQTRLLVARQAALKAYRPQENRTIFWRINHVLHLGEHPVAYSASACIIAAALAFGWWFSTAEMEDHVDIDTQLLTDELPPHAYLDEQFASWLNSSQNPS